MKKICILGATGSIGEQTLKCIKDNEKFKLVAISSHKNIQKTIEIIEKFNPKYVTITDENSYIEIKKYLEDKNLNIELLFGNEGLIKISTLTEVDMVVTAMVGMIGLESTVEAIKAKKQIALANKETLVTGGEIIMKLAKENGIEIIPVDSEHGAIFQCLLGNKKKDIKKIILTASGGPFRGKKTVDLEKVTVKDALNHPNWAMGKKISIDSSTLVNKGLEVIEAHHLFGIEYDNIEVIIHKESIIHSMVEYIDNSIIAQMAVPDMSLPIDYALNYPNRDKSKVESLDLNTIKTLSFEKYDNETFKGLELAFKAGKIGGLMPTVYNMANEIATELFLDEKIKYLEIIEIIEKAMNSFDNKNRDITLENIFEVAKETKEKILLEYKINKDTK